MPAIKSTNQALNRHLGARVAERRRETGMTVRRLASGLALEAGTVKRVERGDKRIDAVLLLAHSVIAVGRSPGRRYGVEFSNAPRGLTRGERP